VVRCVTSDLFEALETLRAWFLQNYQEESKRNEVAGLKAEMQVISEIPEGETVDSE
jgi:hypothetical protein